MQELSQRFLAPLGGALRRYPLGRKGYNGRVERSHRTDDEELYLPYLLEVQDVPHFLDLSARWVYVYNVLRPHTGIGMEGQPPLAVLRRLGYTGDDRIALFPPVILDDISADLVLSCDPETGNDLLAHYSNAKREGVEKVQTYNLWKSGLAAEASATPAKPACAGFAKSAPDDFAGTAAVSTARR